MSVKDYNRETKAHRADHQKRVRTIMSGARGVDGLTDSECELLWRCTQLGIEIAGGWLTRPGGAPYYHSRVVRRASA